MRWWLGVVLLVNAATLLVPAADACQQVPPPGAFSQIEPFSGGRLLTLPKPAELAVLDADGTAVRTYGPLHASSFVAQPEGDWMAYATHSGQTTPSYPGACGGFVGEATMAVHLPDGDPLPISGPTVALAASRSALFGLVTNHTTDERAEHVTSTFTVWRVAWGNWTAPQTLLTGAGDATSLAISPDEAWAVVTARETLTAYDLASGEPSQLSTALPGDPVVAFNGDAVAFVEQPDGSQGRAVLVVQDLADPGSATRHPLHEANPGTWSWYRLDWTGTGLVAIVSTGHPPEECQRGEDEGLVVDCTDVLHARDPFKQPPRLVARLPLGFMGGVHTYDNGTIVLGTTDGLSFVTLDQGRGTPAIQPAFLAVALVGLALLRRR